MLSADEYKTKAEDTLVRLMTLREDFEGLVNTARSTPLDVAPYVDFATELDSLIDGLSESVSDPAGTPSTATADELPPPAIDPLDTLPGSDDNDE